MTKDFSGENEFQGLEDFFDETKILIRTGVKNRDKKKWHEANTRRMQDPEYRRRLSESLKHSDRVKESNRLKAQDPSWKEALKKGLREYISSEDYVNPRGMLGKTHTEQWRINQSELLSGRAQSLEHNNKISDWRKNNWKPKQESVEKTRSKLIGKPSGRSRKVQTPHGVFDKLCEAANYYGVSNESIKNYCNKTIVKVDKQATKDKLLAKGVEFDHNGFPIGFEFLSSAECDLRARRIITPDGIFENIKIAAANYKITTAAMRYRCSNPKNQLFNYENNKETKE